MKDNQMTGKVAYGVVVPPVGFGAKEIEVKYVESENMKAYKLRKAEEQLCIAYSHYVPSTCKSCICGKVTR